MSIRTGMAEMDVSRSLDTGPWTAFQKTVLALTSIAILFDGFDNQLIGIAIPALMLEWRLPREAFGPLIALGLVSMSVGAALGGALGDRLGRRPLLIASCMVFGGATTATAFIGSFEELFALRLVAALGLGAAFPNVTAIASEFSPMRHRSIAVSIAMLSMPMGGLVAGSIAAVLMPEHGWRPLFLIGGLPPLAVALVMAIMLPESPRFLVRAPTRRAELLRTLRRSGLEVSDDATLVDGTAEPAAARVRTLFTPRWRRDTLALWVAYFASLFANYSAFSWAPTMVHGLGFDLAVASSGLAAFNLGGVAGSLIGAWVMDRRGSRTLMLAMGIGGALAGGGAALALDAGVLGAGMLVAAFAVEGFFISGLQALLFALAAHVYPPEIRATGAGLALACGRSGGIVSALTGAAILGLSSGALFYGIAAAALCAVLALLAVRGHTGGETASPRRT